MLTISPTGDIDPNDGVTISHNHGSTISVTITNEHGEQSVVQVPAGGAPWTPPSGWREATFKHDGCPEVFRYIAASASGDG